MLSPTPHHQRPANTPAGAVPPDPVPGAQRRILGVDYWHQQGPDGSELYLTAHGQAVAACLQPENWFSADWFKGHRQRQRGTSTIYRVTTRPVAGRVLELIVRYSRVGEPIPVDTVSNEVFLDAQFNSPFEEVALLTRLRATRLGGSRRVLTKRPLAIFVSPTRLAAWQTGRSEEVLAAKRARNEGQPLDGTRQYLVVYGWIKGCDGEQAANQLGLIGQPRRSFMRMVMNTAVEDLKEAGFRVLDMKPEHVIVRFRRNGRLLRRRDGRLAYALVDYELLEAIPDRPCPPA